MDPHSFSLLDPDLDPGEKDLTNKQKKARKLVIIDISFVSARSGSSLKKQLDQGPH